MQSIWNLRNQTSSVVGCLLKFHKVSSIRITNLFWGCLHFSFLVVFAVAGIPLTKGYFDRLANLLSWEWLGYNYMNSLEICMPISKLQTGEEHTYVLMLMSKRCIYCDETEFELWAVVKDWKRTILAFFFFSFYLFTFACETSWKILYRARNASSTSVWYGIIFTWASKQIRNKIQHVSSSFHQMALALCTR